MKVLIPFLLVFFSIFSCSKTQGPVPKRVVPVENFFSHPEKTGFQLSPDGKNIIYQGKYKNQMNIFISSTSRIINDAHKEGKQLTWFTDKDKWISDVFFVNNDTVIYSQDNYGDENYVLYSLNINTGKSVALTPVWGDKSLPVKDPRRKKGEEKYHVQTYMLDLLENKPYEILIMMNKRDPFKKDVYSLNLQTRKLKLIEKNSGRYLYYQTDWDGNIRLGMVMNGTEREIRYREKVGESLLTKVKFTFNDVFSPVVFHKKNTHWVYVFTNLPDNNGKPRDKVEFVLFDMKKGKEVKTILKHAHYDVDGSVGTSFKRKTPTYILYTTWRRLYYFLDEKTEKIVNSIYRQLRSRGLNEEPRIVSHNENENLFIVSSFSDKDFGKNYIYDAKTDKLDLFYNSNAKLNAKDMVSMKPVSFPSSDGKFQIEGYLTLPYDLTMDNARNIPIVVNPHGGPWARDIWGFNITAQFLANRGYGVLQINFRGSTGYGKKFLKASYKQWGRDMQQDITDGVKMLIEKNIADPEKICIYGGSYGGYAALAGVAFTPDLYKCGIDAFGPSNLVTMLKSYPPQWEMFKEQSKKKVGDYDNPEDLKMLKDVSPFFHADKIKAAMLIAQGGRDVRVPKEESEQIISALKKNNVPYEYYYIENEGHGFAQEKNRVNFYKKIEAFLHKHLGGRYTDAKAED